MTFPSNKPWLAAALATSCALQSFAQQAPEPSESSDQKQVAASGDLGELSLENLLEIEITTVSKRPERLVDAPAAVYVLTDQDLVASGRTSLPEALRLTPGITGGRVNSYTWALSSRGATSVFANKLEVLMDGRSLYTPLFSGVFWDVQQTMLDDVDRIEVIRGPGGTLWGANAVNGVINIITKSASRTRGPLVSLLIGSEEKSADARYGGKLGETGAYRVYGSTFDRDTTESADTPGIGQPIDGENFDDWRMTRLGFRADWEPSSNANYTLLGDGYNGRSSNEVLANDPSSPTLTTVRGQNRLRGSYLLGRRVSTTGSGGDRRLQAYFDYSERAIPRLFSEQRSTFDLDYQEQRLFGSRWNAVWGAGYRRSSDQVVDSPTIFWEPTNRDLDLFNIYFQAEYEWLPDRLRATLGSKIERNEFTDVEVQPSLRLALTTGDHSMIWGSLSKAVRTPSRLDHDARVNAFIDEGPPPTQIALIRGPDFGAEELLAAEIGYRIQGRKWDLDVTGFTNRYDQLVSIEGPGAPVFDGTNLIIPFFFSNLIEGDSKGLETVFDWRPSTRNRWRLIGSILDFDLTSKAGSKDTFTEPTAGNEPNLQLSLTYSALLGNHWSLHSIGRFVDELPNLAIPSYSELDTVITWTPNITWRISLAGQNLLHDSHLEFGAGARIERSIHLRVTWSP